MEKTPIGGSKRSRNAVLRKGTHTRQAHRCGHVTRKLWCRKTRRRRDEVASRVVSCRAIRIRLARIQNLQRAYAVRHIGGKAAPQSEVTVALVQLDRKTGREPRDSLDLPALRQTLGPLRKKPVERQCPDVARHKVVGNITRRKPAAKPGIYEIHQVVEGGRVIQAFGERVGCEE